MLKNIRDFTQTNVQIKSPSRFSFDPMEVAALECMDSGRDTYWLKITFRSGVISTITFDHDYGGGPPNLWQVIRDIETYINQRAVK